MGWSSATELYGRVIEVLQKEVPDEKRRTKIHAKLIDAFEDHDWDTTEELIGEDPAFDKALKKLHPDWEWDE